MHRHPTHTLRRIRAMRHTTQRGTTLAPDQLAGRLYALARRTRDGKLTDQELKYLAQVVDHYDRHITRWTKENNT